ncbi:TnsA endonuclease N-terminal domain-containing protein [Lentibacillus sediminis]|uniref:TnsA endonuclease N-terminal domain-containing protein n=1 Tax=Lentibacillus sediminis TaxID=1940529 RepID=UPI000C1C0147|nr:TnsA endonuclease N-terminal domain-containing protein [Lentibacillus sediminis]
MLSEVEFLSWCEKNNISKDTQDYINKNIRFSQPARSVGGSGRSPSGKYPSKKMGVFIQWESKKVEGPAVLMMENDDTVLEFYDQPNRIKLNYVNNKGKNCGTLYTPDFFVIREDNAGWVEWKDENDLLILSKKQPWKYIKDDHGKWRCPPGEKFAKKLGLEFQVCINSSINWNLHRNFVFLDDYLRREKSLKLNLSILDEIRQVIFQNPGLSLKQLIDHSNDYFYCADDVYASIVNHDIYVDLNEKSLADADSVKVFLHKEHEEMYINLISCEKDLSSSIKISFEIGTKILWDNYIWTIINIGDNNVFLSSEGKYNEISRELFDKLIRDEKIIGQVKEELNDPLVDLITEASEEDYKIANYRLKYVEKYLRFGSKEFKETKVEPNLRKVRDWSGKYRKAENLFGNGYIGLLPKDKNKGNRQGRFSSEVMTLMNEYIQNEYESEVQKNVALVYGSFKNKCEELGYDPPSSVTFYSYIKKRPIDEQTKKRKGKRAEYQKKTYYWELTRTTPRHGDFPFNICHLDHTELDIELVCSSTGKNLGRPYLTLMIDAFSRKVIAFYLSFEPPSYRSCLMVFRDCVRRYNRLPQQVFVDNGKEFHSVYFETLLAMYEKELIWRPAAKPRYGSVLERLFGTTNTNFINNLKGNTQIMKNVREVTKSVNPKNHAIWTLYELSGALDYYFFEIYENIEHPALDRTPKEAFQQGMFYSGERKDFYIPYDKVFEILTLPSTKNGEATVQKNGVKINYIYYWHDDFKRLHSNKVKVKVRFDPFNLGIAYAYINKKWVKCISQYYSILKNLTEKELKFITSEIKKNKHNHAKNFSINAQKIARFITEIEDNIQYELLKNRVDETNNLVQFRNKDKIPQSTSDINPSNNQHFEKNIENEHFDLYEEF